MHDASGSYHIAFNGEIYNHQELRAELTRAGFSFCSQSDTEVLLGAYQQWGIDCLAHLNGMFAFSLYDQQKERLFLARDRAGEKPLFYHLFDGTLHFASELKALMVNSDLPRRINLQALDCYLAMGCVPGDACILDGFNKLPPAHALVFDLRTDAVKVWRYWQLPELTQEAGISLINEAELLEELDTLLEDVVRRQLVADVPVGILLSGGLDSSLVTAMAARTSTRVKTFTIGFPGAGALDETEHARLIARHFATEHLELMADPATADLLPRLAHQYDEPMVDSSMIPTFLVSQLVRQHCTVALGGDGGDELFGGYTRYSHLLSMQPQQRWFPLPVRQAIAWSAMSGLPVGLKGRNWLQGYGVDLAHELPPTVTLFDAATRAKLMANRGAWEPVAEALWRQRIPAHSDLLQRATRMDFGMYLAEDILVKVDRASMLNSLEVRAPLLDYRLIEFAFGRLPSSCKATSSNKKIMLKRLAQRILPTGFDLRRKQGFSIPLAQWLKAGPFRELFHEILTDRQCLFDHKTITGLLRGQDQGRSNSERLFGLVLFELWRRDYGATI